MIAGRARIIARGGSGAGEIEGRDRTAAQGCQIEGQRAPVPCAVTSPEALVCPSRTRPALASTVTLPDTGVPAVPKA